MIRNRGTQKTKEKHKKIKKIKKNLQNFLRGLSISLSSFFSYHRVGGCTTTTTTHSGGGSLEVVFHGESVSEVKNAEKPQENQKIQKTI